MQLRPTTLPVWAEGGDKTQPSNSEINTGWPNSTIPPSRQRFNWVLNFLANGLRYLLQRGISEWDASETYPIGGKVSYGPLEYKAITANTNKQPDISTSDWVVWGFTASNFAASKGANGYKTEPNGVITQWGGGTTVAGTVNITFPIAFPTACRRIILVDNNSGAWSATNLTVFGSSSKNTTGATIKSLSWNGSAFAPAVGDFDYIAIGD